MGGGARADRWVTTGQVAVEASGMKLLEAATSNVGNMVLPGQQRNRSTAVYSGAVVGCYQ